MHGADDSRKRAYCHVAESHDKNPPPREKRRCRKKRGYDSLYCNYCRIEGHSFDQCRRRPRDSYSINANFPTNNNNFPELQYPSSANFQSARNFSPQHFSQHLNSNAVRHMGAMANPQNPVSRPALSSLPLIPPRR